MKVHCVRFFYFSLRSEVQQVQLPRNVIAVPYTHSIQAPVSRHVSPPHSKYTHTHTHGVDSKHSSKFNTHTHTHTHTHTGSADSKKLSKSADAKKSSKSKKKSKIGSLKLVPGLRYEAKRLVHGLRL